MKKIEKEIKKNSTELIESSLPEIDSLDNIPVKTKKTRSFPLFLVPCGAALAIAAIMIPVLLKQFAPIAPANSNSNSALNSSKKGSNSHNNGSSQNNNNSSKNNNYSFNFENYKPAFNSFNEVAYYSYFAFHQGNTPHKGLPIQQRNLNVQNEGTDENETSAPVRERYVDEYGRLHYPIAYDMEYTFQDFLYFEFDTVDNAFLEQRIGNGHIYGLSIKTNIADEIMLVLKRGDHFYSCLSNGGGSHSTGGPTYVEFSSHKTIEGFDIVKDSTNKRYLTIHCGPRTSPDQLVDYPSLSSIDIEGEEFMVDPESVFFDAEPITCGMDELKERLGNNPDFEIFDEYGGPDALVYDAANEENTFTLDEFEDSLFSVSEDKLYLNETEIVSLKGATKIYASEINKDGHRELVFESFSHSIPVFNIFDVKNNKYLYHKTTSDIGGYDYYLAMRDDQLAINLYAPGLTNEEDLLDYGRFSYSGNDGVAIVWQNLYEISHLELNGVYEADGETPVQPEEGTYNFIANTSYIVEIKLVKFGGSTNPSYPSLAHQIVCHPVITTENTQGLYPTWNFLSMEDGIYRYQITFQESVSSNYIFSFYRFYFDIKVVVNEPVEAE